MPAVLLRPACIAIKHDVMALAVAEALGPNKPNQQTNDSI